MDSTRRSTRLDSTMKPLQCLPKQPLKSPTGARLVLYNDDTGYPHRADPSAPARGRWLDNIAATERPFPRNVDPRTRTVGGVIWKWPAVVLTPEEYSMRVGGMSVVELRRKLEEFWGRGGVPGPDGGGDFQDMWVPAWAPREEYDQYGRLWYSDECDHFNHLDCSHWANEECTKWLSYFIAKNHTLGVVHAWFAAFLGVTKVSLFEMEDLDKFYIQHISHLKFRMSFDVCMEGHDEAVDGLPSLSRRAATTIKKGVQVITDKISSMYPRRIWDICANTVIPVAWICGPDFPLAGTVGIRPVSHAWVADGDLTFIMTEANQQLWPIPLPKGTQLEDVRQEMIRLGVRYAWLDVLCLRQQANFANPVGRELIERREQRRLEEWKIDVPTIGAIYSNPDQCSIYGDGPTVIFMNGLGRPFQDEGWASERHWLRRAWTLQESQPLHRCLIAGLPEGADYQWDRWDNRRSGSLWPWNCKVCM